MKIISRKSMQFNRNLSTSSSLVFKPTQQFNNHIIPLHISSSIRNFSTNTDVTSYKIKPPKNLLGIHFVPQQQAYVVERLASYGSEDPVYSVVQLAQTVMRKEIGKITLDKTFEERFELNRSILNSINDRPLRTDWGLECLRYEIKDISPPKGVKVAMEKQAEAELKKRAKALISEGQRQAAINVADGKKMAVILESEAAKRDQVNRAKGEADAILANAQATARAITEVSRAILENGGADDTSLRVAEQYVEVFEKINKMATVTLLPEDSSDAANPISQGVAIHSKLSTTNQ
ncbi:hypothetical protein K7X08_018617 [Anisodus acutangulus]|uniref:Band 7 domain-containing protein n=1 Tax=Anisodus acutangulus TaxID=402998 RepID=A0A9Q1LZL2_9SOLA|nr:hypothetical protein K7X08_018617 [Anisodus acutangulus]